MQDSELTLFSIDTHSHDCFRVIRELRKIGKLERARMKKGDGYMTWPDRGADMIERLVRQGHTPKVVDNAARLLKEMDQARLDWKVNFFFMLALFIFGAAFIIAIDTNFFGMFLK